MLRKDPLTFIRALRRVREEFPEVRGILLGARHSMKDEAEAYERTLRAEAGDAAVFLGERRDVAPLMRAMAALAIPSRQEPLSRVALEASALGVPIVAADVGGMREVIADGETGILVPAADPDALATALLRLLKNPAAAATLGQAARARILKEFTPEGCAAGVAAVYASVTGSR